MNFHICKWHNSSRYRSTHTILQQKSSDYLPISSTEIFVWPRPPGFLATQFYLAIVFDLAIVSLSGY